MVPISRRTERSIASSCHPHQWSKSIDYWPLLDEDLNFIPQIRGESSGGRLQIGFRPQMKRLIGALHHSGSLDGFAIALKNDSFDAGQREILKAIFNKLISVIVAGPVTYAGGSLERPVPPLNAK